jgi:hypothetical protein
MPPAPTNQAVAEALLAFWAEGGVDAMLLDAPLDRIEAGRVARPRSTPPLTAPVALAPVAATGRPDIAAAVAKAQAAAAQAGDLDSLFAAIAAFDGCALKFEGAANQAVIWRGATDAPLMVIGEAPGQEEDQRGQPFVGRAGQLLDKMLASAALTDRVFITNTVFWRPPGNRTPTPAEQQVCAPFVERPRRCSGKTRESFRCAAAGPSGVPPTEPRPWRRCRRCTPRSSCGSLRRRSAPGPTC